MKADGASLLISTHMLDSVEDYWDTAHIMMNGEIAATKHNHGDSAAVGESEESLEELFFRITEAPQASQKGGDVR